MDSSLSKRQSQMLQGLAVLMMLFHHFFTKPENLTLIYFFNADLCMRLAWLCKLCVSMFAFISGYGMNAGCNSQAKPDLKKLYKKAFKRIAALYLTMWVILILFKVCEYFFAGVAVSPLEFALNATGLFYTYNGSWWYIFFYALICLLFPFIRLFLTKCISLKQKLFYALCFALAIAAFYGIGQVLFYPYLATVFLYMVVAVHPPVMLSFIIGILFSEFRLFDHLLRTIKRFVIAEQSYTSVKNPITIVKIVLVKYIFPLLIVMASSYIRIKLAVSAAYCTTDFILVPVLISAFLMWRMQFDSAPSIVLNTGKITDKAVSFIFFFIGNYSTGMWLTHVLIMGYSYEAVARLTHFVVPFYLAEAILALLASMLVSFLISLVKKLIFKAR